ncbi:YeeE/YedE thiosulfate transporter family protein [Mesorhizobium sp. 10J20-29]
MLDAGKLVKKSKISEQASVAPSTRLLAGAAFGLVFGFLLQKGGVGTYHILIGQLLFQDWTVVKIMLTAIVVGMVGIFPLHYFAKVNLHTKPTKLASNIAGGLLFGAGFALIGYCPGTAAAALGQGSWDASFGMAGLIAGSWIYAEMSGTLARTIDKLGDFGKLTFYGLASSKGPIVILVAILLTGFLVVLERLSPSAQSPAEILGSWSYPWV